MWPSPPRPTTSPSAINGTSTSGGCKTTQCHRRIVDVLLIPMLVGFDRALIIALLLSCHQVLPVGLVTSWLGRLIAVSYTHLRAHETDSYLVCRLLLEKKKKNNNQYIL